jgi:type II secretory pathway pseudopilin PulG
MRRQLHRGWSLVELAVVIAGVGALVALLWPLFQRLLVQQGPSSGSDPYTWQVQQAIEGFAAVNLHLPEPLEAVDSPSRPGFVEGWLPAAALGLSDTPRVRYMANRTLTAAPGAILQADPAGLASGAVDKRLDRNGLDFCYAALLQDRNGPVTPAGHRASYAVQTATTPQGSPAEQVPLWLPDEGKPAPVDKTLATTTAGHLELVGRLGCVDRLARLTNAVKQTATEQDLLKLAKLSVEYETLNLKGAEESITNLEWREVTWGVGLAAFGVQTLMAVTQLLTAKEVSLASVGKVAAGLVSISLATAGAAVFMDQTVKALAAAKKGYPAVVQARDDAVAYEADMQALADESVRQVQAWQTKGLQP